MNPPTWLITGGAGFIGSCFVRRHFGDSGPRMIVLDKLTYAGNLDSLTGCLDDPQIRFVRGDIGDAALVGRLMAEENVDAVINFAAESHVDRSIDSPADFVETNVVGTFRLLEATLRHWDRLDEPAKSRFRILHVSTDEVFGSLGTHGKFSEATPFAPNSPYAASKASSDHFVRAYHHTFGLPTLITHCSNNYGPYQFPEKLIPVMILNALEGKPLPIYGDGRQIRDWLHAEDHCDAIDLILRRGEVGQTYGIGGDCERTNLDVVQAICECVKREADSLPLAEPETLIRRVVDRPGHDRRYAIDFSLIHDTLGWSPKRTFEEGLASTVRWYLDNLDWVRRVRSGEYRRIGLRQTTK